MRAARASLNVEDGFEPFFAVLMPAIGSFLSASADLLGCYDAMGVDINDTPVIAAFADAGLANWLIYYRRDLDNLFATDAYWFAPEDFLRLNRHLERLLWQFALFPFYEKDELKIYILGLPQA